MSASAVATPVERPTPRSILSGNYRLPTLGIVVVITVCAVAAMAVATVMPSVVRSLHGVRVYGWAFTAYFIADIVGMIDAGPRTDRNGPTPSLVGGLALFAAGLLVAAAAPDMPVFLAGRALEGVGSGSLIVAVYVLVARVFPDDMRPRAFAALSAAWVVPALVGPAAAGATADAFGWRWVFAGVAPLAVAGAALLVPVLRRLPPPTAGPTGRRVGVTGGVRLALGLAVVQGGGLRLGWWTPLLAVVGIVIAAPPLLRVLPAGAARLRPGLALAVVSRGLLSGAFFGAEAYLPLTLAQVHHGTPRVVGIPLTCAALGWAAGSWLQGRRPAPGSREPLVRGGFLLVAVGVGSLLAVTSPAVTLWLAVPAWTVAGTGMGLAMPTVSVLTLDLSPVDEQGANSSALQVCDVVGSVLAVATGGAFVTAAGTHHLSRALVCVDVLMAVIALAGAALTRRTFSRGEPVRR